MSTGHFVHRCSICNAVIHQCRCPGVKTATFGTCSKCAQGSAVTTPATTREDCIQRLCRVLYGRDADPDDYGRQSQVLHDAATRLEELDWLADKLAAEQTEETPLDLLERAFYLLADGPPNAKASNAVCEAITALEKVAALEGSERVAAREADDDDAERLVLCTYCNGSGEGLASGSRCRACSGTGDADHARRKREADEDRADYMLERRRDRDDDA